MHNPSAHSHDWRADVRARLASQSLGDPGEDEIVEELAQHLEEQFADLAAIVGANAARAQLLAQLSDPAFALITSTRQRPTDRPLAVQSSHWSVSSLTLDVRYAVRSLRRNPGMVAAGTLALALGIGLTTMMFSVLYGTLIKGLPFARASQIAMIHRADPHNEETLISAGDFVRYNAQQKSFDAFAAYSIINANVSGGEVPEHVRATRTTPALFEITNVRPLLGRTFTLSDNTPGAAPTTVISFAMWRDQFGGDSTALGKTARVDGLPHTIIGVMPEKFVFPIEGVKLWLPLIVDPIATPGTGEFLGVIGRLRAGESFDHATSEINAIASQLKMEHAPRTVELPVLAEPYIHATIRTQVYALLYAMLGAVFLVLIVACANVANLLLDRALSRVREIGIRTALGASRVAIIRQALIESSVIALLAAVTGTGFAQAGIVAFNRAFIDLEPPFWTDIRLHPPVLLFVLSIAAIASIMSGILPALQSAKFDISRILKDDSHTTSSRRVGRISRAIVTVEIALSAALLLVSGFMTKSIVKLRNVETGFATSDVFTARISAAPGDSNVQRQFFEALDRQLSATTGVQGAYIGSELPGTGWGRAQISIEGRTYARPQDYPSSRTLAVSPGFFQTFDVRMLSGRTINAQDRAGSLRVAVVNEVFARRNFPGERDVLGKRIRIGAENGQNEWLTIVGVVPKLYAATQDNPFPPEILTAFWQEPRISAASVAIRGPEDVASTATIRKIVSALAPDAPVYLTRSMNDVLAEPMWPWHVFGTTFIIFGVVALILAAIGLYAVMAFSVGRRTREMGIRMALGASSSDVISMVCRQGAVQVLIGIFGGFLIGAAGVQAARQTLYGVQPQDPSVFAVVFAVLSVAAIVACVIPAIRATHVQPTIALRAE